jgi:hypothetical protein
MNLIATSLALLLLLGGAGQAATAGWVLRTAAQ